MLSFLLDAHIDPVVAREVIRHRAACQIVPLRDWEGGTYLNGTDAAILDAASAQGLTLVTFDLQSIPSLLKQRAASIPHAGIVLIDDRTIRPNDRGGLIRSLIRCWDEYRDQDWTNVVLFLYSVPPDE